MAEKLITTAKEGTIASRRRALAVVEDRDVIHKLYADIAPRFADRNGGYTRTIKLAPRKGDAAPMVLVEIVEGAAPKTKPAEEERRRRLLRRRGRPGREQGREQEESEETAPAPAPVAEAATDGPTGGEAADEEESVVDE